MSRISESEESDIYGDLIPFSFDDKLKQVEAKYEDLFHLSKRLKSKVVEQSEKILTLETTVKALRVENSSLGTNISTLIKTAAAEIERKDRQIAELRREIDCVVFRRGKQSNPRPVSPNRRDRQRPESPDRRDRQRPESPDRRDRQRLESPNQWDRQRPLDPPALETQQVEVQQQAVERSWNAVAKPTGTAQNVPDTVFSRRRILANQSKAATPPPPPTPEPAPTEPPRRPRERPYVSPRKPGHRFGHDARAKQFPLHSRSVGSRYRDLCNKRSRGAETPREKRRRGEDRREVLRPRSRADSRGRVAATAGRSGSKPEPKTVPSPDTGAQSIHSKVTDMTKIRPDVSTQPDTKPVIPFEVARLKLPKIEPGTVPSPDTGAQSIHSKVTDMTKIRPDVSTQPDTKPVIPFEVARSNLPKMEPGSAANLPTPRRRRRVVLSDTTPVADKPLPPPTKVAEGMAVPENKPDPSGASEAAQTSSADTVADETVLQPIEKRNLKKIDFKTYLNRPKPLPIQPLCGSANSGELPVSVGDSSALDIDERGMKSTASKALPIMLLCGFANSGELAVSVGESSALDIDERDIKSTSSKTHESNTAGNERTSLETKRQNGDELAASFNLDTSGVFGNDDDVEKPNLTKGDKSHVVIDDKASSNVNRKTDTSTSEVLVKESDVEKSDLSRGDKSDTVINDRVSSKTNRQKADKLIENLHIATTNEVLENGGNEEKPNLNGGNTSDAVMSEEVSSKTKRTNVEEMAPSTGMSEVLDKADDVEMPNLSGGDKPDVVMSEEVSSKTKRTNVEEIAASTGMSEVLDKEDDVEKPNLNEGYKSDAVINEKMSSKRKRKSLEEVTSSLRIDTSVVLEREDDLRKPNLSGGERSDVMMSEEVSSKMKRTKVEEIAASSGTSQIFDKEEDVKKPDLSGGYKSDPVINAKISSKKEWKTVEEISANLHVGTSVVMENLDDVEKPNLSRGDRFDAVINDKVCTKTKSTKVIEMAASTGMSEVLENLDDVENRNLSRGDTSDTVAIIDKVEFSSKTNRNKSAELAVPVSTSEVSNKEDNNREKHNLRKDDKSDRLTVKSDIFLKMSMQESVRLNLSDSKLHDRVLANVTTLPNALGDNAVDIFDDNYQSHEEYKPPHGVSATVKLSIRDSLMLELESTLEAMEASPPRKPRLLSHASVDILSKPKENNLQQSVSADQCNADILSNTKENNLHQSLAEDQVNDDVPSKTKEDNLQQSLTEDQSNAAILSNTKKNNFHQSLKVDQANDVPSKTKENNLRQGLIKDQANVDVASETKHNYLRQALIKDQANVNIPSETKPNNFQRGLAAGQGNALQTAFDTADNSLPQYPVVKVDTSIKTIIPTRETSKEDSHDTKGGGTLVSLTMAGLVESESGTEGEGEGGMVIDLEEGELSASSSEDSAMARVLANVQADMSVVGREASPPPRASTPPPRKRATPRTPTLLHRAGGRPFYTSPRKYPGVRRRDFTPLSCRPYVSAWNYGRDHRRERGPEPPRRSLGGERGPEPPQRSLGEERGPEPPRRSLGGERAGPQAPKTPVTSASAENSREALINKILDPKIGINARNIGQATVRSGRRAPLGSPSSGKVRVTSDAPKKPAPPTIQAPAKPTADKSEPVVFRRRFRPCNLSASDAVSPLQQLAKSVRPAVTGGSAARGRVRTPSVESDGNVSPEPPALEKPKRSPSPLAPSLKKPKRSPSPLAPQYFKGKIPKLKASPISSNDKKKSPSKKKSPGNKKSQEVPSADVNASVSDAQDFSSKKSLDKGLESFMALHYALMKKYTGHKAPEPKKVRPTANDNANVLQNYISKTSVSVSESESESEPSQPEFSDSEGDSSDVWRPPKETKRRRRTDPRKSESAQPKPSTPQNGRASQGGKFVIKRARSTQLGDN